ncbi:MAG: DNA-directed RNA polymerase subunit beta, partial [Desulfovibrio sp.]|nr:DNA-directed RNA polymerase subunit beta [Desulfovibrio sp.]
TYVFDGERVMRKVREDQYRKEEAFVDIIMADGKVSVKKGRPVTKSAWRRMIKEGVQTIEVSPDTILGQYLAHDIVDTATGEVLAEASQELSAELIERIRATGVAEIRVLFTRGMDVSSSMRDTLAADKTTDLATAQIEIYRRLRPSSPPTSEIAASFFENLFRSADYYDLSTVGRYKLNSRLAINEPLELRTLTNEDILKAVKVLVKLKDSHGPADDIDHLGNRRVRPVGELVENQYRIGLVRMERAIKERMSLQEVSTLMPHDLINPKPVAAVLKEFFGTSQLSQFMDQTNPLSEVTHKRRLSALGPGGLTRERAGFEVRDVHTSHYGRICPIETPEGPNIGLIVSLTTYARVNDYGFIETPYRVVKDGRAGDEIRWMDASREASESVAQASLTLSEDGTIQEQLVQARIAGDVNIVPTETITLMDISPSQIVSISAALIPFLEHDDANRALMGSNMQRQAVPLLKSEVPLVGTGMEGVVARDSGACILAKGDGVVHFADAERLIVNYEESENPNTGGSVHYELQKWHKSNQNSCFGQRPCVKVGQKVLKGD